MTPEHFHRVPSLGFPSTNSVTQRNISRWDLRGNGILLLPGPVTQETLSLWHVLGNKKEAVVETEELKMNLRKGFTICFTAVILPWWYKRQGINEICRKNYINTCIRGICFQKPRTQRGLIDKEKCTKKNHCVTFFGTDPFYLIRTDCRELQFCCIMCQYHSEL